jgi:mRNA interferase RelE/StbE
LARVELICEDPFNGNVSKPLQGRLDGTRSSRVGELRIIFEVVQGELLVSVVKIGPRGDVYRG